nr:putative reverse transcriptase domain-containing protein [Tanacetum cinerariifolium]
MSSSTHPIILYDSDVEDAFSSTNFANYTPTLPNYSPASSANTFSEPLENLTHNILAVLAISPFHDDPYMKVMQAYNAELPIQPHIAPPPSLTGESSHKTPLERHEEHIVTILNHLDELPLERIEEMEDKIRGLGNGHDDEVVLARVRIFTLEIIIEDIQCATALEAQAANMANADNTNRNTQPREAPVARKCSYKEFMSCQPFNFKDRKGKFATGTLTEEVLSWRNSFAQPIRIEEAYKITWSEFKKLLIKKECYRFKALNFRGSYYHNSEVNGSVGILETFPFAEDVTCITQDLALASVRLGTRALQKSVHKGKQQCPWKSILAEGQERSPRSARSHGQGIHVDLAKIEAVKNYASPTTPTEKNKKYIWGEDQELAFQLLKRKLCEALILALVEENEDFVIYFDASLQECQKLSGLLIPPETPTWKWERITMDFVTKLPKTSNGHDTILTDGQSERTIQTLEYMLQVCVIDFGKGWEKHLPLVEFSYNNSYHVSIKAALFEALYGRKCRSSVCWAEVGDVQLTGPEIIHETTEKIQIRQHLQLARDRQRSYANLRQKPLEFQVGYHLMLKVSP